MMKGTLVKRDDDINLWEAAYRHRLGLGPFYAAGASATLAGASAFLDTGQTAVGLAAAALAGATWIKTRIRDGARRVYAYTVLGASASWIMTAHEIMPEHLDWTALSLLVGAVTLGIPWWASDRKRAQVKMEDFLRDWPTVAPRIGLGQARMTSLTGTTTGRGGKLTWPRGTYEVDDVLGKLSKLEGAMGARRGTLQMELDGDSTNSVRFDVVEKDPHKKAQMWTLPDYLFHATDPIELGPRSDGQMLSIQRFVEGKGASHLLIAGQTESGKSSAVNRIVAQDVCSEDTFTIGLDFKQVELAPWRKALGFMTSTVSVARELVMAIAEPGGLIDERMSILAGQSPPERVWNTKLGPWIDIVLDEAKDLLGSGDTKLIAAWARILTHGRAAGIGTAKATQYPTLEAIGSSQIRQQIRHLLCFRMLDSDGEKYVGMRERVFAEKIPVGRPGTCFLQTGETVERRPLRVHYLDDALVRAVVAARAGRTPELDARSEAAIIRLFPAFADRERWVPESENGAGAFSVASGNGSENGAGTFPLATENEREPLDDDGEIPALLDDGPDVGLDEVTGIHRERLTPEELASENARREAALAAMPGNRLDERQARAALREALIDAGPKGGSAKDLMAVADRGSSWFYEVINKMADDGKVERVHRGYWAWVARETAMAGSSGNSR